MRSRNSSEDCSTLDAQRFPFEKIARNARSLCCVWPLADTRSHTWHCLDLRRLPTRSSAGLRRSCSPPWPSAPDDSPCQTHPPTLEKRPIVSILYAESRKLFYAS